MTPHAESNLGLPFPPKTDILPLEEEYMQTILSLIVSGIAVLISAYIIPGVTVEGFFVAVVAAVVLAITNAVIRPILELLALPINILTLGLFSFVISALMVMLTSAVVPGFQISGFMSALLFAIVLALVNGVLGSFAPTTKR